MNSYALFKTASSICMIMTVYFTIVADAQMATFFAVMGFYSDWLAEKEK